LICFTESFRLLLINHGTAAPSSWFCTGFATGQTHQKLKAEQVE
jgi:hypothetical protein